MADQTGALCPNVLWRRCEWSEVNLAEFGWNAEHCGLCFVDNNVSLNQHLRSSRVGRWCSCAAPPGLTNRTNLFFTISKSSMVPGAIQARLSFR
eukprot:SAG31_NODE_2445_length_5681_cov_18.644930_5_plen_94_part_00